ncbi:BACON domain-containing protein [uncultured Alistipes sp.]|uniref:BACON domain-containing protein n=1 Tax=uncultured Alistipes sp. TaxID=538949 RepID=UPI0026494B8F|nr:BACON domain-containing protein [uncultured Alistipes sp.]
MAETRIVVRTSAAWELTSPLPAWLTVRPMSGRGDTEVVVSCSEDPTSADRTETAYLTFRVVDFPEVTARLRVRRFKREEVYVKLTPLDEGPPVCLTPGSRITLRKGVSYHVAVILSYAPQRDGPWRASDLNMGTRDNPNPGLDPIVRKLDTIRCMTERAEPYVLDIEYTIPGTTVHPITLYISFS